MRLGFHRQRGPAFHRPCPDFQDVVARATAGRGAAEGTDSLDLLVATMEHKKGAALAHKAGLEASTVSRAARDARTGRDPGPGLSADAKTVIEAALERGLAARRDPGVGELLLALATSECRARDVLTAVGISLPRLVTVVGGPPLA